MPDTSLISYLTDIHFGIGAVHGLPERLAELTIKRPLVVTDAGILRLGLVDRLKLPSLPVFAELPSNPTEESVDQGVAAFRENDCDGIVALGGGSPMDGAKAISLMASHPGPLEQYAVVRGGLAKITPDKPPVIAIPTTAGTGSEVGRAALITMTGGTKLGFIGKPMIPTLAICDPQLTIELPEQLTAATGMDAISHCVETFCSPRYNPVADAIAIDGLRRAWRHLPQAMEKPGNLNHRSEMMMAALQGGLTFQKGLGLIHSLSHPMGALTNLSLHHGTLNAIFLPHVLRFNAEVCPEKMKQMAQALELPAESGEELAAAFESFIQSVGLPTQLRQLGVSQQDLPSVPANALADHSSASNPKPLTLEACRSVLEAAL